MKRMMDHPRIALVLIGSLAAAPVAGQSSPETSRPNKAAFAIKTGDVRLAKGSQDIHDTQWVFDRSASSVFAVEGEGILPESGGNLSLGGEILSYRNALKRATFQGSGFEGKLATLALLAKSKYYFRPGADWQPYVGAGAGIAWADDTGGPVHGVTNGFAYEGVIGMQLRLRNVAVRVEYAALRSRPTDDDGAKIDLSTRGVFVGIAFLFGRR